VVRCLTGTSEEESGEEEIVAANEEELRVRSIGGGAKEESEEEKIVAAHEQIDSVTEHIATGEAGGSTETMEDIRQLA
jgi:hypothetical protein